MTESQHKEIDESLRYRVVTQKTNRMTSFTASKNINTSKSVIFTILKYL